MKEFTRFLSVTCAMMLSLHSLASGGSVTTSPPLSTNNGQGGITFNVASTQAVVIDTIWCAFYGSGSMTVYVWYSQTAINGAPTVSTSNGWVLAGTATITPTNTSSTNAQIQQIPVDLNIPLAANAEYGFWVGNNNSGGVGYTTYASGNATTFTDGTVTVTSGPNTGYGGNAPNPTFTPRQFNGRVVYSKPVIEEFPYCQDFETDDGDFVAGGILNSWEHGAPTNTIISSAYSGSNCWVTNLDGNYNNDELSYVRSPRIDLTTLTDPAIRFYTIRSLETGDDGVTMQVSEDSASTWATLGSASSTPPWYNSSTINALLSQGNGNGWTGSSSGWVPMQHSLAAYGSDTAFFVRWLLAADGNTPGEGYGFDDIVIAESNDIELVELFHPDSFCGNSATEISVSFCNRSVVPKTGFSIVVDTNGGTASYTYSGTLPVCGCDTVSLLTMNTTQGGVWPLEVYLNNTGDVNSWNDSLAGNMTAYEIPSGSISGGGNFCEGQVAQLTFTFNGTGPWNLSYTNGTTSVYNANLSNPFTVAVTDGGTYEILYLTDASGCPADTTGLTGSAVVQFFPSPVIDLGPDSSVCGDYVLDAGAGFTSYNWSTGAATSSVTADASGTYAVTVTDANGCSSTDEVALEVFPLPQVELGDTVLCEGATFIFNAGAPYAAYLWHDGSTGQLFQVDTVTTVSVTVTDFNGCEGSATASITAVVSNPTPTVSSTEGYAPVTLDAGAGYIAYFWNTGAMTQTISVSASGTYTCTVTDAHGCKGKDDAQPKIWPTGTAELLTNEGFVIYPNPARDEFQLEFDQVQRVPEYVELLDLGGKMVRKEPLDRSSTMHRISVSGMAAGRYILRFASEDAIRETPLIIVN